MENENKELKNSVEEVDLQEKVKQDVSEKIAEAAAELQEEIAEAEAYEVDAEAEEDLETDEVVYVKEPTTVTLKLRNLVFSWLGSAILGALIALLGMQIPGWVAAMPEGKTVATVDGIKITDADMEYYLYVAAMEYFEENAEDITGNPADYDWSKEVEDGKTAEEVVREKAIKTAVGEILLMNAGDAAGAEFDQEDARMNAEMQNQQMISTYGEELVVANAKRQAIRSLKQYSRKVEQAIHLQAAETKLTEDPDAFYPANTDMSGYFSADEATYTCIMIAKETKLEDQAEKDAANAEKRTKLEEALTRIQNGEDFATVQKEVNEAASIPASGITITKGESGSPEVEEAVFALGLDGISQVVEDENAFYIVKRITGRTELEKYWEAQAKIAVKERKIAKLSVAQILKDVDAASKEFETLYEKFESGN